MTRPGPGRTIEQGLEEFLAGQAARWSRTYAKVICGSGTEKAASTVVRKLAKWLAAKDYDPDATDAVE